jgi:hypothetical protein
VEETVPDFVALGIVQRYESQAPQVKAWCADVVIGSVYNALVHGKVEGVAQAALLELVRGVGRDELNFFEGVQTARENAKKSSVSEEMESYW